MFGYEAIAARRCAKTRGRLSAVRFRPSSTRAPRCSSCRCRQTFFETTRFDAATMADDVGAAPAEVAWVIAEAVALELPELVERRVAQLRDQGFPVALAEVAPGVLGRGAIGDLMPSFVILDPAYTDYVSTGIRARRAGRPSRILRPAQCARHCPRHCR